MGNGLVNAIFADNGQQLHAVEISISGFRGRQLRLIQSGGEILLPVTSGMRFGLRITNRADTLMAYPAFLADGNNRRNIYWANQETDPNLCPANGGMWEARSMDIVKIDGLCLPDRKLAPFEVNSGNFGGEGVDNDGLRASVLEVYFRTPVNPDATVEAPGGSFPGTTRGSTTRSSAPVIGFGHVQAHERFRTGLAYNQDARLLARVRLIDRREIPSLLTVDGLSLSQNWYAS